MNIPNDPLTLVLIASIVFPGTFLALNTVLGFTHSHVAGTGHHIASAGNTASHHQSAAIAQHHAGQSLQHIHGHIHFSPRSMLRYANLNAIMAFLFAFGLIGFLLHDSLDISLVVSLLFAIIAGLIMATGINMFYLRLAGKESGRLDHGSVIGQLGNVSLPIKPGHIGEVVYVGENGSRHSVGARAQDANEYEAGTEVVIVAEEQGIVTVETWQNFLALRTGPQTMHADQSEG